MKLHGSVQGVACRSTGHPQVKDPKAWYEVVGPHFIDEAGPLTTSAYRVPPIGTVMGVFRVIVFIPYVVVTETELVPVLVPPTATNGRNGLVAEVVYRATENVGD